MHRVSEASEPGVLDMETRLDTIGLGQEVTKATAGRMKLDRSTEKFLAINASGSAAPRHPGLLTRSRHRGAGTRELGVGWGVGLDRLQRVKRFDIDRKSVILVPMKAVTVSSKYQIAIPKEIRKPLGIMAGTRLQVIPDERGFRLVKEPEIDEIKGLLRGIPVVDSAIRDERERGLP
jgi:AbrB family looped-hinge helix DNA binding protein